MPTTGLKTAVSVLIVAAVTVAVWQGVRLRRLAAEKDQAKGRPATNVSTGPIAQRHPHRNATNAMLAAALAKPFDWRFVESDDFLKYIANLRAIGCPEETIRDIITADIDKLFASRAKALKGLAKRHEYWKSDKAGLYDEDTIRKLGELAKERQAVFKELLGADVPSNLEKMAWSDRLDRTLSFLAPDKLQQVVDIIYDQDRRQRLEEARKNQDHEERRRILAEREAALSQVLTPEEKFEYDLRESATAGEMRDSLGGFELTEQEFRKIFALQQKFDEEERSAGAALGSADSAERHQAALRVLNEEMRSSLGEERYRDYAFEREWSQASDLANQFDISRERYRQVFDLKMTAQEEADTVRGAPSLTPAQRQAALDAIRTKTEGAIGGVLGQDLLPGYLRVAPWIRELSASSRTGGHPQ